MNHEVEEIKLKNGGKGLLIDVPGSRVATFQAEFNAGFLFGPKGKYEVPHVMEHLMFTTENYPTQRAFTEATEMNGAYVNAFTSSNALGYDYECAEFEAERIAGLLAEQLSRPVFLESEFRTEIGNVREELQDKLSDNYRMSLSALDSAMLGMDDVSTRISQLESIERIDVERHYRSTHTNKNFRFLIAGDMRKVKGDLTDALETVQLPGGGRIKIPKNYARHLERPVILKREIPQIYYCFVTAYRKPFTYRQYIAVQTMVALLTDGFRSRLFGAVREQGLAYMLHMQVDREVHDTGMSLNGFVTPENAAKLFDLIHDEVGKVKAGEVTDEELESVKTLLRGRRARHYQTPRQLLNFYSGYCNDDELIDFGSFLEHLDGITVEEAVGEFNKLFEEGVWGLSLVGPVEDARAESLQTRLKPLWEK